MQSSLLKIKVLTGLGVLGLVGCLYFSFPLYGYIIWATLVGIFLYSQYTNYKNLISALSEIAIIKQLKESDSTEVPESESIVFERYTLLKNVAKTNKHVDLSTFSDILSAKMSSKLGSASANLTISLGLLGTFFGLMGAIATAGSSMTEKFEIQTLISNIFSDMNGIFGTSLTGLVAFMLLTVAHSIVKSVYIEMMSEVEEYTHFYLIPRFAPTEENQTQTLFDSLHTSLTSFVTNLGTQLTSQTSLVSSSLSDTFERSIVSLKSAIQENNDKVIAKLSDSHRAVLDDIMSQHRTSANETVQTQKELLTSFAAQIQESATKILDAQKDLTNSSSDEIRSKLDHLTTVIQTIPDIQQKAIKEQMELLNLHQEQSRDLQRESLQQNQKQMETIFEKSIDFTESLKESINMISKEGFTKLQEEFVTLAQAARENFEIQERLGKELEEQYSKQMSVLSSFTENIAEGGTLMKVNQVEFQASLEMFNNGVESLLAHVSSSEPEEQNNFYEKLESILEAFHEKASEVLVENALKTQEILIEVLEQVKLQGQSINTFDQEAEA